MPPAPTPPSARPPARKSEPPVVSRTSPAPTAKPTKSTSAATVADAKPEPKSEPKPEPKVEATKPTTKKPEPAAPAVQAIPPAKGVTKEGIAYTKDFDAKWLLAQRTLLLEEREALTGQATRLEDEANALIEEQEMGDVQFDDEGGEGDTMVVERERDLALSAQARQMVADIDAALERLTAGTYGYSVESGRPIPRERLEAIPWATVLVEEKVGGIGRR